MYKYLIIMLLLIMSVFSEYPNDQIAYFSYNDSINGNLTSGVYQSSTYSGSTTPILYVDGIVGKAIQNNYSPSGLSLSRVEHKMWTLNNFNNNNLSVVFDANIREEDSIFTTVNH